MRISDSDFDSIDGIYPMFGRASCAPSNWTPVGGITNRATIRMPTYAISPRAPNALRRPGNIDSVTFLRGRRDGEAERERSVAQSPLRVGG